MPILNPVYDPGPFEIENASILLNSKLHLFNKSSINLSNNLE